MDARTVKKALKARFDFYVRVKGERSGRMRYYNVTIPKRCERYREVVKDEVKQLIKSKGFSGGCDVVIGFCP